MQPKVRRPKHVEMHADTHTSISVKYQIATRPCPLKAPSLQQWTSPQSNVFSKVNPCCIAVQVVPPLTKDSVLVERTERAKLGCAKDASKGCKKYY